MLGQVDSQKSIYHPIGTSQFNQRDVIVATLGLTDSPVTLEDAYTLSKNLVLRISNLVTYDLVSPEIYRQLILRLVREGVVSHEYSLKLKMYTLSLTDRGFGEFDYLMDSVLTKQTVRQFDDFRQLVDLFT